jgi:glycerol-3-phosphate dehydrogenase (NAD(P)+)
MSRIAVIGAGAWGTAISIVLARDAGRSGRHQVSLWAFEPEVCQSIISVRINQAFLPGCLIPEAVAVTTSLQDGLRDADIVVSAMPSHHCRRVFESMAPHLRSQMLFVSATKGIEAETLKRMSQVMDEVIGEKCRFKTPAKLAAISGPSFAKEVARGDPTAIAAASQDAEVAARIQAEFSDGGLRVYTNNDLVGVELGGALKNVIAIAAGVCEGLGLGHNTAAALITRGLAEMTRLAVECGAKRETMAGLAGMGDLVLTCTGGLSRNRTVGVELGKGRKLSTIIGGMHGMVAEGVLTTNAAVGLAKKMRVEMPITNQVHAILHENKSPRDAIRELMTRPGVNE